MLKYTDTKYKSMASEKKATSLSTKSAGQILQTTTDIKHPFQYQNPELERKMIFNKSDSQMDLRFMRLTAQDMIIVGDCTVRNDRVRRTESAFLITERSRLLSYMICGVQ
jgi:hypothetical protein